MQLGGIGIDVAEIGRFRTSKMRRGERFVSNIFSKHEQDYCFSYRDPAPHLAGTFAAKEAVRKIYGDKPMALAQIVSSSVDPMVCPTSSSAVTT